MLFTPQRGDFVIRNSVDIRFEVADYDGHVIAGPFQTLAAAVANVRFQASDRIGIWQQRVDESGRQLGPPSMLLPRRSLSAGIQATAASQRVPLQWSRQTPAPARRYPIE